MGFIFYDIIFLIFFVVFLFFFLHTGRKNLKREGLLILYRTSWGIKLIHFIGDKSKKTFRALSFISIALGYILMISVIYLIGRIVYIYGTRPDVVEAIKVPPIVPLVPYLTEIPSLGFLPPFYFTYWIVIIAIIAITHEFAHGIFAAHNKIKVKSTGFGFFPYFLPIFLAAFVELDEKKMEKKEKFGQLAILSAGTFANVLTAILFFAVIFVFFFFAFTPTGIVFDNYPYNIVETSSITAVNGILVSNPNYNQILNLTYETGFNEVEVYGEKYLITKEALEKQNENQDNLVLYYDAPAVKANLESVIFEINGVKIMSINGLQDELPKYSPGETITLNVLNDDGENYNRDIVLEENPRSKDSAWLGISFASQKSDKFLGKVYSFLTFKDPHVYYESSIGDLGIFVYNLLWWVILISISVALVNMLPVGIFDGGRFFYLTILGITGSENVAKKSFALSTYLILFLFLLLMFFWAISVF